MVTCYPSYDMTPPLPSPAQCSGAPLPGGMAAPMAPMASGKDYSRPLHVDCSVEYELPDAAKPPAGQRSEPLLMIHPCYYRRAEAQRRTRFVNNLPKSLSSPVSSSTPSGRRSKVARLATSSSAVEPAWPQPKPVPVSVPGYPGVPAGVAGAAPVSSCYKVAATADYNAAYRTPLRTPAAPSSAKLDAGTVLSDIIASTCSELNNNNSYMKSSSSQQQQAGQQSQSQQPFERQLGASCAGAGYQQLPGYHPHHDSLLSSANCKTCQYQPSHHLHHHSHHHHSSSSGSSNTNTSTSNSNSSSSNTTSSSRQPSQHHPASQATQVNRLYGGGLVKDANTDLAAHPAPSKARRCGVKRSRSSRAPVQDCARASAASSWSDAMLHLNASSLAFESAAAAAAAASVGGGGVASAAGGVWYGGHQGAHPHHAPVAVPGATAADPLGPPLAPLGSVAWGAMFPHCRELREREDDSRVLWNSDSLLRLVPV